MANRKKVSEEPLGDKEINSGSLIQRNYQLKKQVLFYDKIFSSLNAIVLVFDLNKFRVIWANDQYKKVLGYRKKSKSRPEDVLELYHPEDKDLLFQMKKFFLTNRKSTFTAFYKFRNSVGKYLWLFTSARVFRYSEKEEVFEVLAISIDFTQQLTYHKNIKLLTQEKLQEVNKKYIEKITDREQQIVKYFANGFKTREIAEILGISFHTVNNHRKNILRKLELKNLAALVNFAVDNGLD